MGGISALKREAENRKESIDIKKESFRNIVTGKIYGLMKNEKISKTELSQKMGVSKAAITKLLSGDRNFTIDKITELSNILGYTPAIFFTKKHSFSEIEYSSFMRYFEKTKRTVEIVFENDKKIRATEESEKRFEALFLKENWN
ncbi:hypothetical protein B4O97_08895 [Marispirochaeta aestuarii]|uniref:HTH cro/C1-type domain-containing protein n=1 Tax=Marispirochaeta aestuarii TaxID=1963862 RepID=A0A1Y1RZ15_9SPIO|nr:helix-turn-helix transcriptional regulator [Marispirochaeta aestuarii]ORC35744.1 hypothetical protein B4O97_08895 [Marispirochaeta aestuarii]